MSNEAMGAAFKLRFNHPSARLVLFSLADHHNRSSGKCCPAIPTIMADTCLSRSTVKRALFWLQGKPDPKHPEREFSPVPFIEREEQFDQNGRQTVDKFSLLFMEGVQSEPGGVQPEPGEGFTSEPGEGFNREPPLKRTVRRNRKKEPTAQQAAPAQSRPSQVNGEPQPSLFEKTGPTKRQANKAADEKSGYGLWVAGYKDAIKAAGRAGGVAGLWEGRQVWAMLNDAERADRHAALPGLTRHLKANQFKAPQKIENFLQKGFEDFLSDEPEPEPEVSEAIRKMRAAARRR
jgi:Helix-turn-helix domain